MPIVARAIVGTSSPCVTEANTDCVAIVISIMIPPCKAIPRHDLMNLNPFELVPFIMSATPIGASITRTIISNERYAPMPYAAIPIIHIIPLGIMYVTIIPRHSKIPASSFIVTVYFTACAEFPATFDMKSTPTFTNIATI